MSATTWLPDLFTRPGQSGLLREMFVNLDRGNQYRPVRGSSGHAPPGPMISLRARHMKETRDEEILESRRELRENYQRKLRVAYVGQRIGLAKLIDRVNSDEFWKDAQDHLKRLVSRRQSWHWLRLNPKRTAAWKSELREVAAWLQRNCHDYEANAFKSTFTSAAFTLDAAVALARLKALRPTFDELQEAYVAEES